MENIDHASRSFYGLGIAPGILSILDQLKFTVPTPIQHKAIPITISGKDIIGIAQTGTGKTLAFGIPMIQRLSQIRGRGLILVPTRELAIQVNEALEIFCREFKMGTAVLIGGENMTLQVLALRRNPRIIIATPGRLIDHVSQQRVRLDDVQILVLDEADRMLDMGFMPQIERIINLIPRERQTMLFSATMPPKIVSIASNYMHLPVRTEISQAGTAAELVSQEVYVVQKDLKTKLLEKLLDQYTGTVLLFSRTKIGARKVTRTIRSMGHRVAEIHADRSLDQRREALEGFKSGKYRILVATDIAARGIDVTGIELVLNYDLPDDPDNYVHRIGRTGRAGQEGHAIALATPDQGQDVRAIEKLIRSAIPIGSHPDVPSEKFDFNAPPSASRYSHGSRGGGGHRRHAFSGAPSNSHKSFGGHDRGSLHHNHKPSRHSH